MFLKCYSHNTYQTNDGSALGNIINVYSSLTLNANRGRVAYASSYDSHSYKVLAKELGPYNIHANVVAQA